MRQYKVVHFRRSTFAIPLNEIGEATEQARGMYQDLAAEWHQQLYSEAPARLEVVSARRSRIKQTLSTLNNIGLQAVAVGLAAVWLFWDMLEACKDNCTIAGILTKRGVMVIVFSLILGAAIRIYRKLKSACPETGKIKRAKATA